MIKRASFIAGASWVLDELNKKHPEFNLHTLIPALLDEINQREAAKDDAVEAKSKVTLTDAAG